MRVLLAFGVLLVSTVVASAQQDDIEIDCAAFQKQPDATYRVIAPTILKVGGSTRILAPAVIQPRGATMGSVAIYDVIDTKCGGHQR
jgi:hypothetical protein